MREVWTLQKLFERFPGGIKIPRIQRGYVHGRDDAKSEEIRANFLPALVSAVFDGKPLSLDFVYGVATDGCLLPLDGQQRITTLFLLAWLCGKWNQDWCFTYESRRIPQLFVEGLMRHPYAATNKPSAEIMNADWFLPIWMHDSTVAGMLRMLDAMYMAIGYDRKIDDVSLYVELKMLFGPHEVIGRRKRTEADFKHITFLLHGIQSESDTFDHIFRKMNARGKELSAWENLKAMLDKHIPKTLSFDWRSMADNDWPEKIWPRTGKNVVCLDNAMEKIVRIVYVLNFKLDSEAQKDSLWEMEKRLTSNEKATIAFFEAARVSFSAIEIIAGQWTEDRKNNTLWANESADAIFWKWLMNGQVASRVDRLRFAFLVTQSNVPDAERRRRILLNLLDASTIDRKNDANALTAGLEFLAGSVEIANIVERKAGYSSEQLADEMRKRMLPAAEIVSFEKDDLVYRGSLRFIGWSDFVDEEDVRRRLESIRSAIRNDWIGFYRNLAARIPEDVIGEREYVHVPVYKDDIATWRDKILSSRYFITALASWHVSSEVPVKIPYWVIHLCELLAKCKAECSSLRKFDRWMFLLQNEKRRSPSGKSVRLDCNDKERTNRQLLKDGEIYYANPWPWVQAKDGGAWFNVCHESWWMCETPPRVTRNADGTFPETTNSM